MDGEKHKRGPLVNSLFPEGQPDKPVERPSDIVARIAREPLRDLGKYGADYLMPNAARTPEKRDEADLRASTSAPGSHVERASATSRKPDKATERR